jgi:tRNA A-37 threonylcarbamoyl transferase component Bud32
LAKLRVKVDWRSDPRRIEREAMGMKVLSEIAPPGSITPLIFLDPGQNLLAMKAVEQPHENWKTMLMSGRLELEHVRQFAELLAAIHRAGHDQRDRFATAFDNRNAFESLRLEPYYLYSAERMPAVESFFHQLVNEARTNRYTLVHGDYSPKNILVHKGQLVLLDHEVIHFGDGTVDIGFALTHLLSKANAFSTMRDSFADAARYFWETYRTSVGHEVPEARACRHTLGCLLARCIGRSPLEYLGPEICAGQANAAAAMMGDPPVQIRAITRESQGRIS